MRSQSISRVLSLHMEVMIIYLEPPLPTASSNLTREQKRAVHSSPIQSCSRWGLHGQPVTWLPVSSYLAFPPLPSTQHAEYWAVSLCCTFLGVPPTGCYPAPCPVELGLSSEATFRSLPPRSSDWLR